jgi:SAM-dependent methyltransferase
VHHDHPDRGDQDGGGAVSKADAGADSGLGGKGLLQSPEQWALRMTTLAQTLAELTAYGKPFANDRGLDVGCQDGALTDELSIRTDLHWFGVDPVLEGERRTSKGASLRHGVAHELPYPDRFFACAVLANVFEHVAPDLHQASLDELARVLAIGGILVGQLPNPYFPIESHSRLPFMGWLPPSVQRRYWRLSPVPWSHDFYSVTINDLLRHATVSGFQPVTVRNFNYPIEALPKSVQWAGRALSHPMRHFPWAWQFVLRRSAHA